MRASRPVLPLLLGAALLSLPSLGAAQELSLLQRQQVRMIAGNVDLSNLSRRQVVQIQEALVQDIDQDGKKTYILMALRHAPAKENQ